MSVPVVDPLELVKVASSPAAPPAGTLLVYSKTDDKVYKKTSGNVESELGGGGTGSSASAVMFAFVMA